ncbi:hypothetical protein SKAU_G00228680 [Synaphobranchus kaupii]|uniref:Uncharacterized protein n=1 Tax=Synaphobranchus kaupii TaxID=118154 RepID=A0A9Q1F558_SYNKA|nr:hypothetical protein SKAU_G00228680 [Synaphobranchus kaupii]
MGSPGRPLWAVLDVTAITRSNNPKYTSGSASETPLRTAVCARFRGDLPVPVFRRTAQSSFNLTGALAKAGLKHDTVRWLKKTSHTPALSFTCVDLQCAVKAKRRGLEGTSSKFSSQASIV